MPEPRRHQSANPDRSAPPRRGEPAASQQPVGFDVAERVGDRRAVELRHQRPAPDRRDTEPTAVTPTSCRERQVQLASRFSPPATSRSPVASRRVAAVEDPSKGGIVDTPPASPSSPIPAPAHSPGRLSAMTTTPSGGCSKSIVLISARIATALRNDRWRRAYCVDPPLAPVATPGPRHHVGCSWSRGLRSLVFREAVRGTVVMVGVPAAGGVAITAQPLDSRRPPAPTMDLRPPPGGRWSRLWASCLRRGPSVVWGLTDRVSRPRACGSARRRVVGADYLDAESGGSRQASVSADETYLEAASEDNVERVGMVTLWRRLQASSRRGRVSIRRARRAPKVSKAS